MLEARNISFAYDATNVIEDISFSIAKGKQVSLIGESGCGKSTLLKLLYGLHDLDEGTISYFGKPVLGPKHNLIPGEDYMKYLAQDFGLMPYITVAENIGKYLSNIYPDKKKARINELLDLVEMTAFANVKVQYLSGGQQQRTALAKALALEPEILLLDEPFSQIDTFRTNTLRRRLFRYFREKEITCIIATHDPSDVLSFSDEAIILKDGKIIAQGCPKAIYENPGNHYIASLFGEVNEIPAHWLKSGEEMNRMVLIYPHQLKTVGDSDLETIVKNSYFKGSHYLIEAVSHGKIVFFESRFLIEAGKRVFLALAN